jgi:DNA-binding NtrC family response regulator
MPADNRVLLLDMRAAGRKRLTASLSRLGYTVTLAEHIGMAQAIHEREGIPIVIAELHDQGIQIAELRARLPDSAIVVFGPRTLPAALAAWHAGAEAYVPRPVREDELASALEQALRRRASQVAALAEARGEPSAPAAFRHMAAELARLISAPLAMLLAMIDLLAEELSPDHPGHEHAKAITAAALRIRDIVWMLADIAQQSE